MLDELETEARQLFACDFCGHWAHEHADRISDSAPAPCRVCGCEDFESELADGKDA